MSAARRERIAATAFWLIVAALMTLRVLYPAPGAPAQVAASAAAR